MTEKEIGSDDWASRLIAQSQEAARAGDSKQALAHLHEILERDPQHSAARFQRGILLREQGYFDQARSDFEALLGSHSNDPELYLHLGLTLAKLEDWPAALEVYDRLVALCPEDAWAVYDRGLTRLQLDEVEEALGDFQRALQINPLFVDARARMGQTKIRLGRFDEAAEDYLDFLMQISRNQDLSTSKGVFLSHREDIRRAILHYNEQIDELPFDDRSQAKYHRGLFHTFLTAFSGQHSDSSAAFYDFTAVLEVDPQHSGAHFQLARYYTQRLQRNRALVHLNRVIELEPQLSRAYFERACVQRALSQTDDALSSLNKAIELNPDCPLAYEERSQLYRELGEDEKAAEDKERFLSLRETPESR